MRVQLNQQEQGLFRRLSESNDGKLLIGFLDKLIREAVDIRNITGNAEAEKKGREVAVKLIEENIVNRLKVMSGMIETTNDDDFV